MRSVRELAGKLALLIGLVLVTMAPSPPYLGQQVDGNRNSLGSAANPPAATLFDKTGTAIDAGNPLPVSAAIIAACKKVVVNGSGVAGADITIDSTAGGIVVLAANATQCAFDIRNSGTAPMRCCPSTLTCSSTAGFLLNQGEDLKAGLEGQEAWKCIRTTGTSTTANVAQATP